MACRYLPISNRGITAGGYPVISGWGRIGSPLCSFQKRKAIFPRKIGAMSVQAQICSRKILGTGRAALCFDNGYFRGTPDKRMRGQAGNFYNHITINVCLALESCCRICYIIDRKRESHRSGYPQQQKT